MELKEIMLNSDGSLSTKYGMDGKLAEVIVEENTKNAKELNKDIDNYLDENGIINNFNTSTINLIDHYYKFLIAHPNEWVVISSVNNPTEKNSNEILFKIIDKFKSKEINFEKSYNKIRIIK